MEQIVLTYLKRRGFSNAEEALRQETKQQQQATTTTATAAGTSTTVDSATATAAAAASASASPPSGTLDIHALATEMSLDQHTHLLRQILLYSTAEATPDAYVHAFEQLKRWIADSLDVYRPELQGIVWPIFAHIFIQLIHRGFPHDGQHTQ